MLLWKEATWTLLPVNLAGTALPRNGNVWYHGDAVPSSCSPKSLGTWSCHLTARHGAQLFADVNVTLHVALERGDVECVG